MFIYAGIDEAGYGPLFGPLLVGRAVFAIPNLDAAADPPQLWQRLSKAVCKTLSGRKGRIAVNDSKKLVTSAAGIKHLEVGCLSFAGLAGHRPTSLADWLECLGEQCHRELSGLPWYEPTEVHPWNTLPHCATDGEIAVARNLLTTTANRIGVEVADLGAAVVLEDRFNRMVAATRSKAACNFTFVTQHLAHIWQTFGQHEPFVVVDRQSGRSRYRELLSQAFEGTQIAVLDENETVSAYRLEHADRAMRVQFQVAAEQSHMPVALASMISKYTREMFMARFNAYFCTRVEGLAPTAGYALDGKRFQQEIEPHLPDLGIRLHELRRLC